MTENASFRGHPPPWQGRDNVRLSCVLDAIGGAVITSGDNESVAAVLELCGRREAASAESAR